MHVLSLEGRAAGSARMGNRSRAASSAAAARSIDPIALDGRPLSGTTGVRARSDLQPAPARPAAGRRIRARSASPPASRPIARPREALAQTYHDPATARAHVRAGARARAEPAPPHGHLERRCGAVRAAGLARARRRRVAARAGRRARGQRARPEQPVAARHLRRSADPARARRRRRR